MVSLSTARPLGALTRSGLSSPTPHAKMGCGGSGMPIKTQVTIEDLYHVPDNGKAEIVNGELRLMSPTGALPNRAAGEIFVSLRAHARSTGVGRAYTDKAGFVVDLPNRKSFSPDAAYYIGPDTRGKSLQGAPIFAVEVRSEDDYGPTAEREMAAKRREYFAAGTQVVWDADVLGLKSSACTEL